MGNWTKSDYLNRTFFAELLDKGIFEKGIKKQIFEYVELLEPFDKRIEVGLGLIKRWFGIKNDFAQSIDSSKSEV